MTLNYKIVHCKCEYCGKEFDIKRYSNYNGKEYVQRFCDKACRRRYLMNNPIFINSQDELEKIKKTHPTGFLCIEYKCEKCGKLHRKEIRDRSHDYKLLCKSCLSYEIQINFDKHKKEAILERVNETKIKKYGSLENFNKIRQEKVKETCFKRYGVNNSFQVSEFREKSKQTCLKRYGTENYSQTTEFKEKFQNTMIERYGVNYTLQSKELRQKVINTRIKNEGANFKEDDAIKSKQTKLNRYGDENYNNNEKHKATCRKKYGVSSYSQTEKFQQQRYKHYYYDNTYFDSSWELAVWIYCKDKGISIKREPIYFDYIYNNEMYRYYPDFLIDDQLVEIKGDHLMKTMLENVNSLDHSKYQCMLENNIRVMTKKDVSLYLEYVKDAYGKNYLREFKLI